MRRPSITHSGSAGRLGPSRANALHPPVCCGASFWSRTRSAEVANWPHFATALHCVDQSETRTRHLHCTRGDVLPSHHSSRSTAAPMSSLPLPPHFCSAIDHRCSSLEVCNPICCCGLGSCCTFLPILHLSFSNPYSTYHLPTNITTPGFTALGCWLCFFYRESFATTHRIFIRRRRTRFPH